jgi:hypothetical protein
LTAGLQSIDDQVAAWVGQAFDAYADRCETTLVKVFKRSGSDAVDLRAWLYEASPWGDPVGRADTMHDEPFYTVGMYLGLEPDALDTPQILQAYEVLEASQGWSAVAR